jgi:hypothetical protein
MRLSHSQYSPFPRRPLPLWLPWRLWLGPRDEGGTPVARPHPLHFSCCVNRLFCRSRTLYFVDSSSR